MLYCSAAQYAVAFCDPNPALALSSIVYGHAYFRLDTTLKSSYTALVPYNHPNRSRPFSFQANSAERRFPARRYKLRRVYLVKLFSRGSISQLLPLLLFEDSWTVQLAGPTCGGAIDGMWSLEDHPQSGLHSNLTTRKHRLGSDFASGRSNIPRQGVAFAGAISYSVGQ